MNIYKQFLETAKKTVISKVYTIQKLYNMLVVN